MNTDRRKLLGLACGTVAVAAGGATAAAAEPGQAGDAAPRAVLAGAIEGVTDADGKREFKAARGKGFDFKTDRNRFAVTFAKPLPGVPVVILTSHNEGQPQDVRLEEVSKTGFTVYCDPHPIHRDGCGFSFVVFVV